jgi:hypothetical protein
MAANSTVFPWPPYYGHFKFFEARMLQHSRVRELKTLGDGRYDLTDNFGNVLKIFICECYSFGAAEYIEAKNALGSIDVVVINSAWCGYTMEAKRLCRSERVGLFKVGDFMAALNKAKPWDHLTEAEANQFKEKGWL